MHAKGNGQPRTRRVAAIGGGGALRDAAHRVGLEEHQHFVQALQHHRLAHEVRGAEPQTLPRLGLVDDAGDRDDRDTEVSDRTQLQEVETAHTGELHVEEDGVRAVAREPGERGFGGVDDHGLVAELQQEVAEHIAEVDLVLDNQHSHLRSSLAR